MSEEELEIVIAEGRRTGVIEPAEHEIIENAFWLGERRVNDIMTPRHEVRWLEAGADPDRLLEVVAGAPHSRYLVSDESLNDVEGFVVAGELLAASLRGPPVDVAEHVRRPLIVPESMPILTLLERFKETGIHFAVVVDEYGSFEGVATLSDILEELVGDVSPPGPGDTPEAVEKSRGVWIVAGGIHVDRLLELLDLEGEIDLSNEPYQTLGGLVADRLGRIPAAGDRFVWRGFELTVERMAGLRVEAVRIRSRAVEA